MHSYFTTEIARMRTEEMIARADRYRLAQKARSHKDRRADGQSRRTRLVYRKALAAVALSASHYGGGTR